MAGAGNEGLGGPAPDGATARVYAIVARTRRRAVVFRRGPSKWVRLLLWDLETDTVQGGQWFKGRIYERNGDLNPDGTMLVYHAASQKKPFCLWTAVSRPPYLTALALWPTIGTTGGGLFADESLLLLNQLGICPNDSMQPAPGFQVPPGLELAPLQKQPGWQHEIAVECERLRRDGWTISDSTMIEHSTASRTTPRYRYTFEPSQRFQRPVNQEATLEVSLHARDERRGRREVLSAAIQNGERRRDLGRIGWADGDHNGDVLYAAAGCLYRIKAGHLVTGDAILVADLNGMAFEPMEAPDDALR